MASKKQEMMKIAIATETSTTKSLSPTHRGGGYVPQRYRRKKGIIRRWLEIFGIGLDHIILKDSLAEEVVDGLELTPADLRKMRTAFDLIDVGGNGYFDYQDFLVAVREQESGHYTKILFDLMDVNKDTVVDFHEWIRVLGTYCMFTSDDLQQFVLVSFDNDGDGFLGNQDLKNMIRLVDAEHKGKGPISPQEIVNGYDGDNKAKINFGEFQNLCRNYPMVSYSAQHLQEDLHYLTLGKSFFAKVMEKKHAVMELLTYQREHKGDLPPITTRERRMFKSSTTHWWSTGGQKDPRKVVLPSASTRWLLLAGWKLYIAHDVLDDMAKKRNANNTVLNGKDISTNRRAEGGGGGGEMSGGRIKGEKGNGKETSAGRIKGGKGDGGEMSGGRIKGGRVDGGELSVGRIKGGKGDVHMTKRVDDDTYLSTTGKAIEAAKKTNKHRRTTYEL